MAKDPQIELHKQWLGYLQPQGLVVAPAALIECQALLDTNVARQQNVLRELLVEVPITETERSVVVPSLRTLCIELLGWRDTDLVPGQETGIEATLPDYNETLRPDFAVKRPSADSEHPWQMLVRTLPHGTDYDSEAERTDDRQWHASHHARFERLLKESGVPIGLAFNGTHVRLTYAPKGESSGSLTFPIASLAEVSGRPMLAGLLLLLDHNRLFLASKGQTLSDLLEKSRQFQNLVSTKLAQQVLRALHELLRGFQGAHAHSGDRLLQEWLTTQAKRDDIYGGLLTVMLRLIFILYAEDRGLLGNDEAWQDGYSVLGLCDRLRSDADRFPDTMEHRFGAWAQLLATFRMLFDGARHGKLQLPPREGYLFHPDGGEEACYQFLEGRPYGVARQIGEVVTPPRISDKIVWEVLRNLMVLDGERISYRTLNVEQIGSVYETMMGFRFERTLGPSLAIKPAKKHGAAAVINLRELVEEKPGSRAKWLKEHADCKLTGSALAELKAARTPEEAAIALAKKIFALTPSLLPAGTFVLQPTDERRRSGSHYTPPQLTQPIVEATLQPLLDQLDENPTAEAVLEMKVCDPAMGSGAFLVEACRQLGARVALAWLNHPETKPMVPPDEDDLLFAKRLVATRCLYGVDQNPFAVALAKLSLWLETFAKEHAFTFLDHALKSGDSLVGLSEEEIAAFHWDVAQRGALVERLLRPKLKAVEALRAKIRSADESTRESTLRRWHRDAEDALDDVRLIGDLVVAAFCSGSTKREREEQRQLVAADVEEWLRSEGDAPRLRVELVRRVAELRGGDLGLTPFHWDVEFPEVFARGGFDGFVGNPPFAGKNTIISSQRSGYLDWLKQVHSQSHGNADLVAHFFRRAFTLLREGGTLGLIATNTIRQGDTRATGLRWICQNGGEIYRADRRIKWPGLAAVVVSVVHISRANLEGPRMLDGRIVERITAFLFNDGTHDDPLPLPTNAHKSFIGSYVLGMGFTFDDSKEDANPLAEMHRLKAENPKNGDRIFAYLGGEEVNDSPTHSHHRYVINFGELDEDAARSGWPELMDILERKAKPGRLQQNDRGAKEKWWQFIRPRPELAKAIQGMDRVLVIARVGEHGLFTFLPTGIVYSEQLVVCAFSSTPAFAALQSRLHDSWLRFFASTLEDRLRYTPSDCFETFPFPSRFDTNTHLEAAGTEYFEFRASLMADPLVRRELIPHAPEPEGLTKTYNRFHDPDENSPGIKTLRALHANMDRAMLDAYGWTDLHPTHAFLLNYEEDEDEDSTHRRKKSWRYRWPDEFRDLVLMRLLRLNQERAGGKQLQSPVEARPSGKPDRQARRRKGDHTPSLFE